MSDSRIPLLIDTDPGVDDALAILMAFDDPAHDVVGLTITAGNVGLKHTVANALKLCEIAGREDVPVFPGCPDPLLHPAPDAADVHGADGFGDTGYRPAARQADSEHAANAIIRLSHVHAGKLLLVALGPLTNLALAFKLDPSLPSRIARLVVMGGAVNGRGNITPYAEFNTHFDPEAAHIVFAAFARFDLSDWEATLAHGILHQDVDVWCATDAAEARFYDAISSANRVWSGERRGARWYSADALAMAYALKPELAETADHHLRVALDGPARGMTLVDWQGKHPAPANARILLRYPQPAFEASVASALGVGG